MQVRFILYLYLLGIVLMVGAFYYGRLTKPFRILTLLVGYTLCSEFTGRHLAFSIQNSNPVYHVLIIVEFNAYAMMFLYLLKHAHFSIVIWTSCIVVTLFSLIDTFWLQNILTFPTYSLLVSHGVVVLLVLLLYNEMRGYPVQVNILKTSVFWLNNAILLYCAGDFLIWGIYNYFVGKHINNDLISALSYGINILYYLFLGMAILINQNGKYRDHYGIE